MKNLLSRFTLACLFILFSLSLTSVVKAENVTSTPDIVEPEPEVVEEVEEPEVQVVTDDTPTSTPEVAVEEEVATSTPEVVEEETATTTPEVVEEEVEMVVEEVEPRLLSTAELEEAAEKILNYIESQIDEEGKVLEGGTTDWATMSFGANDDYIEELENGEVMLEYLKTYPFDGASDMNVCATYPRNILALLAAGLDPQEEILTELLNAVQTTCLQEDYYGNPGGDEGINDDIFALFASIELGSTTGTEMMVEKIVANQSETGAFNWNWGDAPDATGGAINALVYAKNHDIEVEQTVLDNAVVYLKDSQFDNGAWGYSDWVTGEPVPSVITTSWVIMGLNALNQGQIDWTTKTGENPWNILVDNLNDEGYYESVWAPGTADWFDIKHAVPALLGKTWPIVLEPKQAVEETPEVVTPPSNSPSYSVIGRTPGNNTPVATTPPEDLPEDTATTTLEIIEEKITTSTPELIEDVIATTTLDIVEEDEIEKEEVEQVGEVEQLVHPKNLPPAPYIPRTVQVPTQEIAGEKIEKEVENVVDDVADEDKQAEQLQQLEPSEQIEGDMSNAEKLFYTLMTAGAGLGIYLIWKVVKSLI